MDQCSYKEIPNGNEDSSRVYLWRQILVSSGVWLAYFQYGLSTGASTVLIPQLRREANSTDAVPDTLASWIMSGCNYGAVVALFLITMVSLFVGRRSIFLFVTAFTIAADLFFYFSTSPIQIMISQIMQGLNGASILTVDLMIIGEYSSSEYRGVFLTIKTAMMFWGIWVSNAIGTFFHWTNIGIVATACSGCALIMALFWPESPYWLAERGQLEECARSHRWLRGNNKQSKEELEVLLNTYDQSVKKYVSDNYFKKMHFFLKEITKKEFYKPTLIGVLVIMMYHATGKLVFSIYAIDIVKKITNNESTAYIAMLFLDGITVLGMYVGSVLSKFLKRRTLYFSCSAVGIMSLLIISCYLYLIHLAVFEENSYFTISLLTVFSISVSMGPIVLSSSLIGELLPLKLRSFAFFIVVFFNFAVMGNTIKMAPAMFAALKTHGTFLMYGICSSLLLYLLYKFLPETKDITLHEIRDLMINGQKGNKLISNTA